MANVPTVTGCTAYLTAAGMSADVDEVTAALATEIATQARRCRVPQVLDVDGVTLVADYPADLEEAVYRRVAHNLALRGLPLGVSPTITDGAIAATRVGGLDAEVGRLEAGFRKVVFG
jgi:hypothetical protein